MQISEPRATLTIDAIQAMLNAARRDGGRVLVEAKDILRLARGLND